jgi:hypothetical protein
MTLHQVAKGLAAKGLVAKGDENQMEHFQVKDVGAL